LINARWPLAALYEAEGRHEDARELVQEILAVNPEYTVGAALQAMRFLAPDQALQFRANLRQAGLPEE
jgi:hypothetical protein